tara:strand:- start:1628 stop:1885 length:258 start_codon:yes stop_codon:yes gene_type:complete
VSLSIALRLRNLDVLEKKLQESSDPRSPRFGQHSTTAELVDLTAPSAATVTAVRDWLARNNIVNTELSGTQGFLRVKDVTIQQVR